MQNRRPILVISILILALLFLILLTNPRNLWERENRSVALRNTEDVDRIVLVDFYNSTELTTGDGSWYLFGTEPVNPVTVDNLLIAASRLEVSSIVGNEVYEGADEPQGDTREVTFFKGDKVLLTYGLRVVSGRYLVHPHDSETAFYVVLPGYPGLVLDRVFSATPDHYREHLIMNLRPSEISGIDIDLASGEAFRFTQDQKGNIRCDPANELTRLPDGVPNELAMKLLFSYFTSIRYEQIAGIPIDSLSGAINDGRKMATIGVESFSGERYSLQVFSYHEMPGSEPHLFRALVLFNDAQDAMIVNYIYLDVLMRGL
ncbi:MAG: DUF4340 domain-containing protein, partial [Bacteroidales bacterium]|nr:DUF4340 domain-containing protein [Bacteroidales bacterium]